MATKDWIFLFPIIVVVLMIILIFLPVMYITIDVPAIPLSVEGDVMPLGGGLMDELEPYIAANESAENLNNIFMWVGIVFAIGYGLDALLLFIGAIRVKTGSKDLEKARKKWLSTGIFKIISQIIVFAIFEFYIIGMLADQGVNLGFTMGLGMILTMVAGGILIFTWILAKIAG